VAASIQTAAESGGTAVAGRGQPVAPPPGSFRGFWRTLKQLFHEAVGAVFAVLALAWLNGILRAWTRDAARWMIALAAGVVLLFVFFAFTSFRRARKL
jgi:hypothetical protein